MRDEVIAAMNCDWTSVMRTLAGPVPDGSPVWYQKHMSHHMVGPVGFDDFAGFTHAFLIREPERMIALLTGLRTRNFFALLPLTLLLIAATASAARTFSFCGPLS